MMQPGATNRVLDAQANVDTQFIRHLGIPYCSLYDLGYTSLGGTTDTHPNPVLKAPNGGVTGGIEQSEAHSRKYRPAYELVDDDEERLGRDNGEVITL